MFPDPHVRMRATSATCACAENLDGGPGGQLTAGELEMGNNTKYYDFCDY